MGNMSKTRKRKFRIVLAVLLVLLVAAVVVGPTLAALLWEHKWDAASVRIDHPNVGKFHSYGYEYRAGIGGMIVTFTKFIDCGDGAWGERVYAQIQDNGNVMVKGGCLKMTPTLAPTQRP